MSLSGLDAPDVDNAFQKVQQERGGWFLLEYTSRDTVQVLGDGVRGLHEMRDAALSYYSRSSEIKPLFGVAQFRRRKVVVKLVPEDASRLFKARVQVHWQALIARFPKHDTEYEVSKCEELDDAKLTNHIELHSSRSSSGSQKKPVLDGIDEAAEDASNPDRSEEKQFKRRTIEPAEASKGPRDTASLLERSRNLVAAINSPDPRPERIPEEPEASETHTDIPWANGHSSDQRRASQSASMRSPRTDDGAESVFEFVPRLSSQTARPETTSSAYDPYSDFFKPKVKLGPRPSFDRRPGSSKSEVRAVAALPSGIRSYRPSPSRPKSRESLFTLGGTPVAPPVPNIPQSYMPTHRPSSSSASVKSLPAALPKIVGMTPEKARLMKFRDMYRQREQKVRSRGGSALEAPPVPPLPKELDQIQETIMEDVVRSEAVEPSIKTSERAEAGLGDEQSPGQLLQQDEQIPEEVEPIKAISVQSLTPGEPSLKSTIAAAERGSLPIAVIHPPISELTAPPEEPVISGFTVTAPVDAEYARTIEQTEDLGSKMPEGNEMKADECSATKATRELEECSSSTIGSGESATNTPELDVEDAQKTQENDKAAFILPLTPADSTAAMSPTKPTAAPLDNMNGEVRGLPVDNSTPRASMDLDRDDGMSPVTPAKHLESPEKMDDLRDPDRTPRPAQTETFEALQTDASSESSVEHRALSSDSEEDSTGFPWKSYKEMRRELSNPISVDVSTTTSESGEYDDDLMEELRSATVEQATQIPMARSPALPSFPTFSRQPSGMSDISLARKSTASLIIVSRGSPQPTSPSEMQRELTTALPERTSRTPTGERISALPQQTEDGMAVPKKGRIGSGVANKIAELQRNFSRSSQTSTSSQRDKGSPPGGRKVSLVSQRASALADTPVRSSSSSSRRHSGVRNGENDSPNDRDRVQFTSALDSRISVFEKSQAEKGNKPESFSVTATIVRSELTQDYDRPTPTSTPTIVTPLGLHESPIVINHDTILQTPPITVLTESTPEKHPRQLDEEYEAQITSLTQTQKSHRRKRSSLSIITGALRTTESTRAVAAPQIATPDRADPRRRSVDASWRSLARRMSRDLSVAPAQGRPQGHSPGLSPPPPMTRSISSSSLDTTGSDVSESTRPHSQAMNGTTPARPSRTSRMMRRMSSSMSSIASLTRLPLASPVKDSTIPSSTRRAGDDPISPVHEPTRPAPVDLGDLNVQFPDTLLWKRRWVAIDVEGFLVLRPVESHQAASGPAAALAGAGAAKRFHLSEFLEPFAPDLERLEMPNSVVLDFVDGRVLQCACSSGRGQGWTVEALKEAWRGWAA